MHGEYLVVLCTCPDRPCAETIARELVSRGLAACVSLGAGSTSFYTWKGRLEQGEEVPLLIKTTRARYAALEQALHALHPYELPEILALPVVAGLPGYLQWVKECTTAGS
jgi:periplasmic divalent cation tolerance protein